MKIFVDCEFWERPSSGGQLLTPITVGAVREDGKELLVENSAFSWVLCTDTWLNENVKPYLGKGEFLWRGEMAERFRTFAGNRPEFWSYYANYDWVVIASLFGRMVDLPKSWPKYCLGLQQVIKTGHVDRSLLPKQDKEDSAQHNALADARHHKRIYEALRAHGGLQL